MGNLTKCCANEGVRTRGDKRNTKRTNKRIPSKNQNEEPEAKGPESPSYYLIRMKPCHGQAPHSPTGR